MGDKVSGSRWGTRTGNNTVMKWQETAEDVWGWQQRNPKCRNWLEQKLKAEQNPKELKQITTERKRGRKNPQKLTDHDIKKTAGFNFQTRIFSDVSIQKSACQKRWFQGRFMCQRHFECSLLWHQHETTSSKLNQTYQSQIAFSLQSDRIHLYAGCSNLRGIYPIWPFWLTLGYKTKVWP